jgi:hypothetical protein
VSTDEPTVVTYDVGTHDGTRRLLVGAERGDVHAVIETKAGTDREELLDVLEEIAASYETVDEIARRGR